MRTSALDSKKANKPFLGVSKLGPWTMEILSGFGDPMFRTLNMQMGRCTNQSTIFALFGINRPFEGADQFDPYPQELNLPCKMLLVILADNMASDT